MVSTNIDNNRVVDHAKIEVSRSLSSIYKPLTSIQRAAIQLYNHGFNVMPIPRVGMNHGGKKPPYGRFSNLFTTRLGQSSLLQLFDRSNIAVLCGRLSNNLFVLDCDVINTFKWVGQELEKRDINTWIVRTSRGGHYWLLCSDGEVKNVNPQSGLQVIGIRKYILAPPSVHPTGLIYEWENQKGDLPQSISLEVLDFLQGLSITNPGIDMLPPVAHKVLVEKDANDYPSNSEAELASAMSLAKAGYEEEEIIIIFELYKPPHFANKRNPTDWLQRYLLPKAFEFSETAPNNYHFVEWALSRPWPGRTGETDKHVFLALCQRFQLEGREHFRASVREVTELANISKNTAQRSLKRLIANNFIIQTGKDRLSRAYLYKFPEELRRS